MTFLLNILTTLLSIASMQPHNRVIEYSVGNQVEFDRIPEVVAYAAAGQSVNIKIGQGIYYFSDMFINLTGRKLIGDVTITGENAVLVAGGADFASGNQMPRNYFDAQYVVVDKSTCEMLPIWKHCEQPGRKIEVVDRMSKLCRVRTTMADKPSSKCQNTLVMVPEWYTWGTYKVREIRNGYLYFLADDLAEVSGGYNVNYDWIYGREYPRFRVCEADSIERPFHVCTATAFIECNDAEIKSLILKGLTFIGGAEPYNGVLNFNNSHCESISITQCVFKWMNSSAVSICGMNDVTISDNTFLEINNNCLYIRNTSKDITVVGNHFENIGFFKNRFCISCAADNYYIADNTMKNFCYGGIGVGEWYKFEKTAPARGVIENNELWYTADYIADKANYTLMDSGAIYLWTQNDGAVVRNNIIHDYVGMKDNRGIFCDDGAYGFSITGNRITNTPNSYSIDSRLCLDVEKEDGSFVDRVNVNNEIKNNKVDGKIRFELHP